MGIHLVLLGAVFVCAALAGSSPAVPVAGADFECVLIASVSDPSSEPVAAFPSFPAREQIEEKKRESVPPVVPLKEERQEPQREETQERVREEEQERTNPFEDLFTNVNSSSARVPAAILAAPPSSLSQNGEAEPVSAERTPEQEATSQAALLNTSRPEPRNKLIALSGNARQGEDQTQESGLNLIALRERYDHMILTRLAAAKRYPAAARRQSVTGRGRVAFRVHPDGSISDIRLLISSGSTLLDEEVIRTVKRAAPLPPVPRDLLSAAPLKRSVWISFELERRARLD